MGLFGKLFGKEAELPQLDPSSPAASKLNEYKSALEPFVSKVNDRMEFVPAGDTVYAYIGKPPDTFGLVWFENNRVINFKTITADKGLEQKQIQIIFGQLGEAYAAAVSAPRYETVIGGKKVIVLPSDHLAGKIGEIVHSVTG